MPWGALADPVIPMERVYDSNLIQGATAIGSFGSVNFNETDFPTPLLSEADAKLDQVDVQTRSQKSIGNEMSDPLTNRSAPRLSWRHWRSRNDFTPRPIQPKTCA